MGDKPSNVPGPPALPSLPPPPPSVAPRATIFVSDPSAEAEQVAARLRLAGYAVVDVPLSMLVARVAVQRPRIVIVDADADGAYAAVFRMRELPDAEGVDVLFLGRASETGPDSAEDAGNFFARPIDVALLVRRVDTLTSEDLAQPSRPGGTSVGPSSAALPSPSMRLDRPSAPPPSRSIHSPPPPSLSRRAGTGLSNELLDLLAEAEQRVQKRLTPDSTPPTPEEEIEAVLPADLLAALDEPLEEPEPIEEEDRGRHTTASGGRRVTTGAGERLDVSAPEGRPAVSLEQPPTVPPPRRDSSSPRDEAPATVGPGAFFGVPTLGESLTSHSALTPTTDAGASSPGTDGGGREEKVRTSPGPTSLSPTGVVSLSPAAAPGTVASVSRATVWSAPPAVDDTPPSDETAQSLAFSQTGPVPTPVTTGLRHAGGGAIPGASGATPGPAEAALGPDDAPDVVARAIVTRSSGSLSFEADGGLRRIILREGDIVTCASSLSAEALTAFLEERGDLPRDKAEALAGRVRAFGRHAGAALVAHGVLRQDQLWPILRAHAEWILGRALRIDRGVFVREEEAPGRLKGEPSVFGGSTGAEVLVDVLRRVTSESDAIKRLGGGASTLAAGPNDALLVECALDERETHVARSAVGRRVEELVQTHGGETAALLYALTVLRVLEPIRAASVPRVGRSSTMATDPLDEEAIVQKIEARLALVDEGDYFAILGVPRSATGYEIRRAYLELRRTFEPARMLTPGLAHLATEVAKIATVLEEAFDILRDDVRRERYRRAIEAQPTSA